MPNGNFIPTREAQLIAFGANYNDKAGISPASYHLPPEMGTEIVNAFSEFEQRYNESQNPSTRTPEVTELKREARKNFERVVRETAAVIQADPATTNAMRTSLGLSLRGNGPTPVPVPQGMPVVEVKGVVGRVVRLRLKDAETDRRRKPPGVQGAWLYVFVGDEPPASLEAMELRGMVTRTNPVVLLGDEVAADTKVWLSAAWVNAKGQPGQASVPVATWTNRLSFGKAA